MEKKQQSSLKKNRQKLTLRVKRLTADATLPTRAHVGDVGFDLYANKETIINAGAVGKVSTGIAVNIPDGYWLKFEDRSGFFTGVRLKVGAGIIDNGYTGELIVCMLNATTLPIKIIKGEKFAQAILHELVEASVEEVNDLENTERGDKGFGSSDK